jgi:hypothetical protein
MLIDEYHQYRFISKQDVPSGSTKDLQAYLDSETGCTVKVIGPAESCGLHFRVPCWSGDGKPNATGSATISGPQKFTDLMDAVHLKEK